MYTLPETNISPSSQHVWPFPKVGYVSIKSKSTGNLLSKPWRNPSIFYSKEQKSLEVRPPFIYRFIYQLPFFYRIRVYHHPKNNHHVKNHVNDFQNKATWNFGDFSVAQTGILTWQTRHFLHWSFLARKYLRFCLRFGSHCVTSLPIRFFACSPTRNICFRNKRYLQSI